MINLINKIDEEPYVKLYKLYDNALESGQSNVEAMLIASYSNETNEVDARYVNLKFISSDNFIFFSNYKSPKANQFNAHDQISAVMYWNAIDTQIRMKAKIHKVSKEFNNKYFTNRQPEKNAVAISSKQSIEIDSYEKVINNYEKTLETKNLKKCPEYWGGFEFTPYSIEFWQGNEKRINKRELFVKNEGKWVSKFLQP